MKYIAPLAASAMAVALLALQIQGVFEYTAGGSVYTRNTMIAAAVMVALLPLVVDSAWHRKAYFSSVIMAISTAALLWYSIPATLGRIGETKEAKVVSTAKTLEDKARVEADYAETKRLVDEANRWQAKACQGGVGKDCKAATFVLNQRQASLEKLTKQLDQFAPPPPGDAGSDILSWAMFGAKVENIRKSQTLAYVLGMDLAVFSLMCFVATCMRRPVAITEETTVTEKTIEDLKRIHAEDLPELKVIPKQPSKNESRVRIWTADFYETHGRAPNKAELLEAFPDVPYISAWRYAGKELAEVTA